MTYESINPNTGKLLMSFEHLNATQLEKSLAVAENCFQTWRHKSYAERAVILNKAAALMLANVDDFVHDFNFNRTNFVARLTCRASKHFFLRNQCCDVVCWQRNIVPSNGRRNRSIGRRRRHHRTDFQNYFSGVK